VSTLVLLILNDDVIFDICVNICVYLYDYYELFVIRSH